MMKMRWKHVAWLATVFLAASAHVVSIDDSRNGDIIPPTPTPTTTNDSEILDKRKSSVYYDNIIINADTNTDNEGNSGDKDTIQGSNEGNGSDPEEAGNGNESQQASQEVPPSNSNEDGGEQSVEVEQPNSNENDRSNDYVSQEEIVKTNIVETEGGSVQGYYLHGARSYIDIPYGKFSKPFEAPTKADPWEGVHEVNEHLKRCPQIDESGDYVGDIDCLTLSVFAPKDVENAAVLFHIYDGDFNIGSAANSIYGPEYLVNKGIILVLPNYRIGALGFLCLNNDVAPGNAALKDLTLALEWTSNNIASFGGNSEKIIVSGDGRSGALAGYLALSPSSRSYLSGVITESGTMLAHWAIDRNPSTTASALEEYLGNNINIESLVKAAKDINFRPCIESGTNAFMKETPWELLHKEDEKLDIPFIIGSSNHAGLQEAMFHTAESLSEFEKNIKKFLPDDLKFENDRETDTIAEKIKKMYFKDVSITVKPIEQVSLFYTDAYYLGPSIRLARALVAAGAKVYFYEFSFVGEMNRMLQSLSSTVRGAARGDLACYTFMQEGEGPAEGSVEETMVNMITDLWVSFLQTGVPSAEEVAWKNLEKVDFKEEKWLSIGTEVKESTGLHVDRLELWTDVYDRHFIEKSLAIDIQSSLLLIFTGILMLAIQK